MYSGSRGNASARGGHVVIRHGRARRRLLVEVPVDERAPIIRRYLEVAPGARPHIPVDRTAPLPDFERVAARVPVFAVVPDAGGSPPTVPTGRAS
jgi:hypothetical protein